MIINYQANRRSADPKFFGYIFLENASFLKTSNLAHLIIGEFGKGMALASLGAALFPCVFRVARLRPKPKMRRIYARRIVSFGAIMKNVHSLRDWPTRKLPRNTMGQLSLAVYSHFAVTKRCAGALPYPTRGSIGSLGNLGEEAIEKRALSPACVSAGARTALNVSSFRDKLRVTVATFLHNDTVTHTPRPARRMKCQTH